MAVVALTHKWHRQPQVSVSAYGAELRHIWALNVGGVRQVRNSSREAHGTFGSGTGTATGNYWVQTPYGWGVLFDDTGTGSANSKIIVIGNSAGSAAPRGDIFTIMLHFYMGVAGNTQTIYGTGSNGVQLRVNTDNTVALLKSGVAQIGTSTGTLSATTWTHVAVTYDGASAAFYLNGAASGTASSAQTFSHGQQYFLGSKASTDTEGITNGTRMVALSVWDRVLGQGEIMARRDNPWLDFMPLKRRIWVDAPAAAGGGGPVTTGKLLLSNDMQGNMGRVSGNFQ